MRTEEISLDNIEPPEPSEKLHPYEDENEDEWKDFLDTIGTQPQKPLEVIENGNGTYEIVDGDRRFRALRENDADEVWCLVANDESDFGESNKVLNMVRANEHRKDSNELQRARHIAQFVSPWLLPPGERRDFDRMTQSDLASEIGAKNRSNISFWLEPLRDENPLRAALSNMSSGRTVSDEEIETIDNIVDLLVRGGNDGDRVIQTGQMSFVPGELADMEGPSLGEIRTAAEKAANQGWRAQRFLNYVRDNFAYEEEEDNIEGEVLGDTSAPWEDDSYDDDDTGVDVDDVDVDDEDSNVEMDIPSPDVNWDNAVAGTEVDNLSEMKSKQMIMQPLEDDAAIAFQVLQELSGMSEREVMREIVEPIVIDRTLSVLDSGEA